VHGGRLSAEKCGCLDRGSVAPMPKAKPETGIAGQLTVQERVLLL
jgi:hypothetical protein